MVVGDTRLAVSSMVYQCEYLVNAILAVAWAVAVVRSDDTTTVKGRFT